MSQASQVRTYDRAASVVFLKTNERFGGLSNMAPGFPLQVNGVRIRTSEALYQACRFPHLPEVQRKIIDEHSPMTAKMRSKPFHDNSRPDWDAVRVKIMKWCLRAKLAQHWSTFGELLLDTGDRPIVEQSRKDDFWGAKIGDDDKLVGMNVLGRLLMELREEIKSGMREHSTVVLPLEIPDFLLFGQSIGPVGFGFKFDAAQSQEGKRETDIREIPAPVETAQRSLFEFTDEATEARAAESQITAQSPRPADQPETINGLRPYAEMKPSGLPWLGDVPVHWDIKKLGHIGRFFKGSGGTKEDALPFGIPCVRYGDLYTTHSFFIRSARTFLSVERAREYTQIQHGDVLFAASGETIDEIGKSAVNLIAGEARCGGDIIVLRPNADLLPKFLGYATDCRPAAIQKAMAGRGTTVKHIYPDELKQIRLALAPLDEQRLIVRFLDWHGAQTAKLIRAKKKIIALLNEQKQAIIHRAVTRGLDPSVRLKPSGIPWLGDVPEGWEVKKLKFLTRFNNGIAFKPSDWEASGTPIIRIQNLNGSGAFNYTTKSDLPSDMLIENGDIVFSWSGNIGTSFGPFVWEREFSGYLNQHIFKLERITQHRKYFYYVLKAVTKHVEENAQGIIGLVHITKPELGSIAVPLAPPHEQAGIATWLDDQLIGLNGLVDRAQREISLIQELRTRLIADVVTGKLDVRAIAASLPETVELEPIDDLVEGDDLDEAVDDAENEEVAA